MMNSVKLASFGLVCALVSAVPAGAVTRNTTKVKFDRPVAVPGHVLPAGEYSLERVDASAVVVSKDGRFVALLPVQAASRAEAGATVVTLQNARGATPELRSWFFDGEHAGVTFNAAAAPRAAAIAKPCTVADSTQH